MVWDMCMLTQYGRMAEAHWRKYLPRLVEKLEANGLFHERLFEAEEKTKEEMREMTCRLNKRSKYTPQQVEDTAWVLLREKYLLLPPEDK